MSEAANDLEKFEGVQLRYLSPARMAAMDDRESFVPHHTRGCIVRYIEEGKPPGSFLSALIGNDLKMTFGHADHMNSPAIGTIVAWFYNFAPSDCWGSIEAVEQWLLRSQQPSQGG